MNDKERAKQVAKKEVLSRIVTLEQAKESFKNWISEALAGGAFPKETIDFWLEVSSEVDKITHSNI